jgi:hypothetical protein
MVIAFVGSPHRIDDRGSQVLKALRQIGFESYYQAEQTGWVLYLEGSTDLAILQAFARRLNHSAAKALERPYVHYAGNQPMSALSHYHGLKEALPNLQGIALFDRLESGPPESGALECIDWNRREIENYLCSQATLESYARTSAEEDALGPLLAIPEASRRKDAMQEAIQEVQGAMQTLGRGSPWSKDAKVSDDFLTPVFRAYFGKLGLPNLMNKRDFYELAEHVPEDGIDLEVNEKLDAIVQAAERARPRIEETKES